MSPLPQRPDAKKSSGLLIVTVVLAIALVGMIAYAAYDKMAAKGAGAGSEAFLSSNEASSQLVAFINEVYGPKVGNVTLKSVTEKNGLYEVTLSMTENGAASDQIVFVTKDAKIFIPQVIDMAVMKEQFKAYQAQQAAAPQGTATTGQPAAGTGNTAQPAPAQ